MRVVASADNIAPRFSPDADNSDVAAGKVETEDIVEVPVDPVDESLHSKEVAALPSDPQSSTRESGLPSLRLMR